MLGLTNNPPFLSWQKQIESLWQRGNGWTHITLELSPFPLSQNSKVFNSIWRKVGRAWVNIGKQTHCHSTLPPFYSKQEKIPHQARAHNSRLLHGVCFISPISVLQVFPRLPAKPVLWQCVNCQPTVLACRLTVGSIYTYLLLTISHCTPQRNRYSLLASSQTAKYLQDGENLQAKIRFCPSLLVTSASGSPLQNHVYIHRITHTSQFSHKKDNPYPSC
jgi:hypothetical protein